MTIKKKLHPEYFEAISTGKKKFELRLGDWKCIAGDKILLQEWDPKTKKYTGREILKTVTYVGTFRIDELFWPKEEIEKHGLMVMSIE
jgi:ASC-1-like (ASCH) protein